MKQKYQIVTDKEELKIPSESITDLDEINEISSALITTLNERKNNDIGLAAPQIGIKKRICYLRAKESILLVNPTTIEEKGMTWYQEGCLSFPGVSLKTKRYESIVVKVDWLGEISKNGNINWSENKTLYFSKNDAIKMENDKDLLECIAAQHEINHLDGILFFDKQWKNEPIVKSKKIGRNDLCPCQSGKKYKKCCGKVI